MKVGDIVRQNNKLLSIRKMGKPQPSSDMVGVVIDIRDQLPPKEYESEWLKGWINQIGRQVDVMWSNGKLSKNFAENSLSLASEKESCLSNQKKEVK